MPNLTFPPPRSETASIGSNSANPSLALQIVEPGRPERTVPLGPGKWTLGSSKQCQIILRDENVRPLHCLLMSNAGELVATRWAAGVLHNGQDFSTAELRLGDSLSIGAVELHIVPNPPAGRIPPKAAPPRELHSPAPQQSTPDSTEPTPRPEFERLQQANDTARHRSRKLLDLLRSLRSEAQGVEQQANALRAELQSALADRDQIADQLAALRNHSDVLQQQSAEELDRLIGELNASFEKSQAAEAGALEYAVQIDELRRELTTLADEHHSLSRRADDAEAQRQRLEEDLQNARQEVVEQEAILEQAREAVESVERERDEQLAELQSKLDAHEASRQEFEQQQEQQLEAARETIELVERQRDESLVEQDRLLGELEQARTAHGASDHTQEAETFRLEAAAAAAAAELAEATRRGEKLDKELSKLIEERDKLASTRTEYQLRRQEWEQQSVEHEKQFQAVVAELERERTNFAAAQSEHAAKQQEYSAQESRLVEIRAERDRLQSERTGRAERENELKAALNQKSVRIAELETEHERLCEVLNNLERESFDQVDRCKQLEQQLAEVSTEREELQAASPLQAGRVVELEQALAERDRQIATLEARQREAEQALASLERSLAEQTVEVERLQKEIAESQAQASRLTDEKLAAENAQQQVQDSFDQYRLEAENRDEQLAALEASRSALEHELAEQIGSAERLEEEIADLRLAKEESEAAHREETERRQSLDSQLAERGSRVELYEADLKSLRAELSRANTSAADLTRQLAAKTEELEALTSRETNSAVDHEQVGRLEQEKADLIERIEELAQRIENLTTEVDVERTRSADSELQLRQLVELYEQTKQEFDLAQQGLLAAEKALTLRAGAARPASEEQAYQESLAAAEVVDPLDDFGDNSAPLVDSYPDESFGESQPYPAEYEFDSHDASPSGLAEDKAADFAEKGVLDDAADAFEPSPRSKSDFFDPPAKEKTPDREFQPTSFIEQFSHLLEEGGSEPPEPQSPLHRAEASSPAASLEKDDDTALREYMENMMRRVQATPGNVAPSSAPLFQFSSPVAAAEPAPEPESFVESADPFDPIDLASLKASSQKPALPTDIKAMRALANSSARAAIATHHKRRNLEKSVVSLLVALIATAVGLYLILTASEPASATFVGGCVSASVGAISTLKLLRHVLESIRAGSFKKTSNNAPQDG